VAGLGDVLGGRYRLVELLGQGGMATIYRATDSELGRDAAVKVLHPEYGHDPDFVARFRQEAHAAASLSHPGIVGVYDFGTDEAGPYLVMELVDGEDLAALIRRNGPLPPRQAARLVAEVARALEAAHERGIVHRDVKPGNIMLTANGRVKVTDFGIARAWADARLTLPGTTLGSVHYFSPEQALGEPTTAASDIYSLGIVLFELLTGRRPWEGDSAASVAMARISASPPSASEVRPSVPPALDAIDRKAMAPEAADRFASAGAMAEALEAFLEEGRVVGARPAVPVAVGPTPPARSGGSIREAGATPVASSLPVAALAAAPLVPATPPASLSPTLPQATQPPTPPPADPDDGGRTSPWVWVAGLLGLVILVVAGLLLFRVLAASSRPAATPGPGSVTLPSFLNATYADANAQANRLGIVLAPTYVKQNNVADGTIVDQVPPAGTSVTQGSTVNVDVVSGKDLVSVPSIVGLTESAAIQALVSANLQLGTRTVDFDPAVPAGSIIRQGLPAGLSVPTDTPVDYLVSEGPQPTPSPSPLPSPSPPPSPQPSPSPSAAPNGEPSPSSTPVLVPVSSYVGLSVGDAIAQAASEVLEIQWQGEGIPPMDFVVVAQSIQPGLAVPLGSTIQLIAAPPSPSPSP
jgi:serine/threonine-protein kinase